MSRLSWLMLATHVPASGRSGGMVRYVVELARELAIHPEVDLSILTTPGTRPFFTDLVGREDRVHVLPPLPTAVRSLLERPGWAVPVYQRSFDVVHGTKHLLPRAGRSRRVLTVHDLLPIDRPQDFPWLKRRALVGPYRASIRAADVLLCVSAATRQRLVQDQPSAARRAVVVPLAMSSTLRSVTPRPVPELLNRRFALVVGDASPRKNLAVVVAAWEQVTAQVPDAVLAFIGPSGWGVDERGDRFDRLVASGAILPLGAVGDDVLRWCYEHSRVVACPSLLEGFGLPSIEALHFDAPLVTSTDAALVEASGIAAEHLPPHDVNSWVGALVRRIAVPRPSPKPRPSRTWAAVADESVRAVLDGWTP